MVLLCGIPTESPLALAIERLEAMGAAHVVLSQRQFERSPFCFEIAGGSISGFVEIGGTRYPLDTFDAVYTRLMDDQMLPELAGEPPGSPLRAHARRWHDALGRWCEIAPCRVVNRAGAMASNGSKPFQAQAIARRGFLVPETLVTSDPALARAFLERRGDVVFKSIGGIRSIVRRFGEADLARIEAIRACPVQFQAFVPGRNVRVHTVGDAVFATGISTDATDYRYAARDGGAPADLEPVELSADLAAQAVALARDLELPFAGIDLKITPDDEVYCFEVNPSPAYSYYETHTGQPISAALANYLVTGRAWSPSNRRT